MVAEPEIQPAMAVWAVLLLTCSVYLLLTVLTYVILRRTNDSATKSRARAAEAGESEGDVYQTLEATRVAPTVTKGDGG
ncbi:MAG: hypothetical protein RIF41_23640 [Polyangiaceae bacterium]